MRCRNSIAPRLSPERNLTRTRFRAVRGPLLSSDCTMQKCAERSNRRSRATRAFSREAPFALPSHATAPSRDHRPRRAALASASRSASRGLSASAGDECLNCRKRCAEMHRIRDASLSFQAGPQGIRRVRNECLKKSLRTPSRSCHEAFLDGPDREHDKPQLWRVDRCKRY
jgi:hypothetical protein